MILARHVREILFPNVFSDTTNFCFQRRISLHIYYAWIRRSDSQSKSSWIIHGVRKRQPRYPLPTPNVQPLAHRAIDSPLLQSLRGGREARSPGLHTLKEAFDITYAVHRAEEEGAHRRAAGGRGFLQNLNEDDEEEEEGYDNAVVEEARRRERRSQGESRKAMAAPDDRANASRNRSKPRAANRDDRLDGGRAGPRDRHHENQHRVFALDMDNATLLGRRHRKNDAGLIQSSPLAQGTVPYADPGSPMRLG